MLPVSVDVAAIVQFDRPVLCGLMTQGCLVVSASVGVVDPLVTQLFVLRWVVRDASIRALKSGHEMSLEGDGSVLIADQGRFVGRSVASPREWLLPAEKMTHDRHLSPTFCPSRAF